MELWDGVTIYNGGLTMPIWTRSEIATFRRELLLKWVLDDRNAHRAQVLEDAKVDGLLAAYLHEGDATPTIDVDDMRVNALDTIQDSLEANAVNTVDNPPSTIADRMKTYKRSRKSGPKSHVITDNEVDAIQNSPSTIAG